MLTRGGSGNIHVHVRSVGGIGYLSSLGAVWAGVGVRQYIYGVDISLVTRVGVHFVGGLTACDQRVSTWGGTTPEQEGDGGGESGQKPLSVGRPACVGAQTCWHVKDQGWRRLAETNMFSKCVALSLEKP